MKIIYLVIIILFLPVFLFAQKITGYVYARTDSLPLPSANVYWLKAKKGTTTNNKGFFELETVSLPDKLIVSFVGFANDTLSIDAQPNKLLRIYLTEGNVLGVMEVTGQQSGTFMSLRPAIPVETITAKELKKAACCNLSESFETNASVDVAVTDAVTGGKKIQMLGLDGTYTQILFENMPFLRGLSSSYGLGFVPGTWIESMQITKGAGSVVNGYESMAGQINIEFLKPETHDLLYINMYGNNQSRAEINVHSAQKMAKNAHNLFFIHGSQVPGRIDMNNDGFFDMPQSKQLNVFNRWGFETKHWESRSGVKAMWDERLSGEIGFQPKVDVAAQPWFGVGVTNRLVEVFTKNGFFTDAFPNSSLGTIVSGKYQEQNMFFGMGKYSGRQENMYANAIFQTQPKNGFHTLKLGGSFMYDAYLETFNDSLFSRTEIVPGMFTEYTFNDDKKFSLVAGLRSDWHNLYGFRVTPRLHLKYNLLEGTVARLSAGRGFRVANIFTENSTVFSSARVVHIPAALLPEDAINTGGSIVHTFSLFNREASITADYFYTYFINQVVVDYDQHPQEIWFYNLNGHSYSHSTQIEGSFFPLPRFEMKAAYKYYLVETTYNGILLSRPLIPRDRMLLSLGYTTFSEKWKMDVSGNYFGKSRLPNTSANPEVYRLPEFSSPYLLVHTQITRVFKRLEAYLGIENLLNFIQPNAIVAANDPFGRYFDASMIWGPVNGRMVYGGFRMNIKKKNK